MPSSLRSLSNCWLYGFLDTAYLGRRDPTAIARQMIAGGVDILQLRAKNLAPAQLIALAKRILPITRAAGVPLLINDFPEIARQVDADGVHLGQEDIQRISIAATRNILGQGKMIGISTHSLTQSLVAQQQNPDYLGLGPIFATATKPQAKPIGLLAITSVAKKVSIPFFCIGGIDPENIRQVLAAGARRVAVVSAILCAIDPILATRQLKQALLAARHVESPWRLARDKPV